MKKKYALEQALEAKRAELKALFDEHTNEDGYTFSSDQLQEVRRRNDELAELGKELDAVKEIEAIEEGVKRDGRKSTPAQDRKQAEEVPNRLMDRIVAGAGYKAWKNRHVPYAQVEVEQDMRTAAAKALISTAAGYAPDNPRTTIVVDSAQEEARVASLIPQTNTTLTAINYMEETTFTNGAAFVAEGGLKGEAALAWTERTAAVRKLAVWVPVTDEQLEDVPSMQSIVERRLIQMVMLKEDDKLLNGSGVAPEILGFLNTPGIQSQAKGADPVPDAIMKAMTKVRVNGKATPTGLILHPNDWQDIRLLRTTDGLYIWGSPSEMGPARIWGLDTVTTTAMTEGTGLTGDFQTYSEIWRRAAITVIIGLVDDQLIRNQKTIVVEERLALTVYRPAAFAQITGI